MFKEKKVNCANDFNPLHNGLQDFFEFAPFGIFQADMEGHLTAANPEFAWILGYESPDLLIEQKLDIRSQIFADKKTADDFFFTLFESEQVKRFRARLHRKDGASCWMASFAKLTRDMSGRVNGFYGVFIDIKETVRAENRLKKLNHELQKVSNLDGLTQIANRRKFDNTLQQEWKRLYREKGMVSLILSDIDFFKRYNDTYGHLAGDECLHTVAQAIQNQVKRPTDLVARYGGEEFAVILPNTSSQGAAFLAEKIRIAVMDLKIPHSRSEACGHVTLSLGASNLMPDDSCSPEMLINIADSALYLAKELGRNQFVCNT